MVERRYSVIEQIDVGGMAEVWRGKSSSLQGLEKQVAIKRVLPHLAQNQKFLEMFLDEARLSLHLNHANIVQTFDVVQANQSYFIVMEWIDGLNLKKVLTSLNAANEKLSIPEAVFIISEAGKGLSHAHELRSPDGQALNIVHRDVSPPNLLVSKDGEVKLVDFGLAKAASQLSETDPGVVKGKFSYISPEAAHGQSLDARADIFSLGLVLWELITGKKLFLGTNDLETVKAVRRCEIPDIREIDRRVDEQLAAIINQALSKDPNGRFQSCEEFSQALIKYLFARGTPVTNFSLALLIKRIVDRSAVSEGNNESASPKMQAESTLEDTDFEALAFNPKQASKSNTEAQVVSTTSQPSTETVPKDPKNHTPHKSNDMPARAIDSQPPVTGPSLPQNLKVDSVKKGFIDDGLIAGIGMGLVVGTLIIVYGYFTLI